ncbi:MAG: Cof-type HAD-IIB family hydrolase [Paramuribaculum sp.]|nr:Cof-type HAD-IIB family hydrolase [Paramuribaculum sp.]
MKEMYERITTLNEDGRKLLFVTDLDGTLLDNYARIPSASARLISELSHCGALISIATARTPATVDLLMAHTFTTIPAIVMTGAAMWNRAHRCYMDPRFIGAADGAFAISRCREAGINPFIYTLGHGNVLHVYHNGGLNPKEDKFVADRRGLLLKKFHIDEPAGLADSFDNTMLIFATGPVEPIFELAEEFRQKTALSVSAYHDTYNPSAGILEILAGGVSKAAAVLKLKEITGADKLTVFGDNLNDLSMMAVADTAVATANAVESVRDAADIVIGPNTEDSVALYILSQLEKHM